MHEMQRVVAAIPAYNAGEGLLSLTDRLSEDRFDDIYILDDHSSDGSVEAVKRQHPEVHVLGDNTNKGAGGNRNRMLQTDETGIILFIDADMEPHSSQLANTVRRAMDDTQTGLLGGLILNEDLTPMAWNYGFEMHPGKDALFGALYDLLRNPATPDSLRVDMLRLLNSYDMAFNWVAPEDLPLETRRVDWVAEGLFAVRANTFRRLGGYDETFRYHEGQDLAHQMRQVGKTVRFTPAFSVVHHALDVRGKARAEEGAASRYRFFQKHWGLDKATYDKLHAWNQPKS